MPVRTRRTRRRGRLATRLADWTMFAVSVYWALLVGRWCLRVYAAVMGDPSGSLTAFHRWLGFPFTAIPVVGTLPVLPDLFAVLVSGVLALSVLGVLAGWSRERSGR
ncbi:hypothetical protein OO015_03250 [Thermomicrobium sp. 4228-Ro]|uniref:hypothetical protein n=1 Tax=Thermomicrobium sp. 4228-Ro TaxID=2993937 RepID=UPI002249950E|nr:hypothetical protein [Thermomicrobium sp. 4228-Ro]MCX2726509.1 hypothetical protein [Thermomicrobium sp. 4228-Ro]